MSNLVIATNVAGLNSHRSLKIVSEKGEKASERLSSGYKINRAADDAAGLAISEKMRNQIKGLNMASKNSADAISLIQTAEGALQETHEMLKRMRELVIQGANDTNVSGDREKIGLELAQLMCEIQATADKTEFNTQKLIDGTWDSNGGGQLYFQLGANQKQNLLLNIATLDASILTNSQVALSTPATVKVASGTDWDDYLDDIDTAIGTVSTQRANLGAVQNRLEHTIKNLDVASENLSAAESRIRDTDMAKEMMEFTKSNILSQAGMSMLAQANQQPNNVLSIVRG